MLYDVLPPFILLLSFGGIIVLMSRVVLRMRNEQFSQQAHVHAQTAVVHEASLLGPGNKGVQLVKNRLVHAAQSVAANAANIRDVARTIQMPKATGLREKISSLAQQGKSGAMSVGGNIKQRVVNSTRRITELQREAQQTSEEVVTSAVVTPSIRLVRHNASDVTHHGEKTSLMSKIVKREKEETPLEKAANAIANQQFDSAEDILVPYIMKHALDANAYVLLGNAAIGRESWEEAMEIFRQVIKLDNSLCDAYVQLGHAALNAGKFTQAIEALQHARNLDAKNIQVREDLLFIAQRMDNKVVEKGVQEELEELKKELA